MDGGIEAEDWGGVVREDWGRVEGRKKEVNEAKSTVKFRCGTPRCATPKTKY
jgi:hypothetical protein